jgi:chromosome segregation ATPase
MRKLGLIFCTLALAASGFAQQQTSDSQVTAALLNEIRQLRQDLQVTASVIQRSQILMYRLQMETAALSRATQRYDDARSRCSSYQSQAKMMGTQIESMEARVSALQSPAEQKSQLDNIARLKAQLTMYANEEQQCQPRITDAQSQMQAAQARVEDFQGQLDRLDKLLAGASGK